MRPPFPYLGAKTRIAPRIIERFPDHTHYVEVFAGSCAILLAKTRSLAETVNDRDGALTNLWRIIRDQPKQLNDLLALTPHSREEYYQAVREPSPASRLEAARRTFVVLTQGISRTTQHGGMWGQYVKYSPKSRPLPAQIENRRERIQQVTDRLANVTLESRDALRMVPRYGRTTSNLLYVDPPYPVDTRAGTKYPHDLTDNDHETLLTQLKNCDAQVVVSSYTNELYEDTLTGWDRWEIPTTARGGGVKNKQAVEIIWRKPC